MAASGTLTARRGCLRPLCRNFARGSCRWGQSCRFSHDRNSAQICRYFQSGFCSYGEQCSYQHIQEELVPSRYGGSLHAPLPLGPGAWHCAHGHGPGLGGSPAHLRLPCPQRAHVTFKFPNTEVEVEEKDKKNVTAPGNIQWGATGGEFVPAHARRASEAAGSQLQGLALDADSSDPRERVVEMATGTDPAEVSVELGAVAAPVPTEALRAQSEAVVCGICMDRVYEKPLPEDRLFGILPNCSHAYCVGCIRKWRRSRDFQSTVIKACPECRITSSYYIPHKYWISDVGEKEKLIRTFKARTGKIRCKFFVRNRGYCPFRSDCIYLHELPTRRLPPHRQQRLRMPTEFSPSSLESSSEEDEELCMLEWALTLTVMEMEFHYSSYGHEMLLTDFRDSD
ncbi:LOW QUALITY PROTEIN: probable E3 ubiquitin-protein ligase makorin-1 [Myiozetetes cayanensis]|uniref:LOW QUALITY PROTEIN: probable E3 ubiquitin-protein ligase makorin-1 n=1 Tax=Myiozetetes cayanensis TaxID=478635 RepID=UPI00215E7EEB|nr:LOW QUALITY PROTEIN: probable E3 ubiquitin-protein ligase makorin-1 [Myiozetetes cayanensis]